MNQQDWWKDSVVYQIYPRSFQDSNGDGIGDIPGITSRLPYLKELGVDVIWLSPVYQSPNDDMGYDISDYQNIMKEFGTMEDFDKMLETAHSLGIKIMMDLVVNHTSDEHHWFAEAKKSKDNPYRDYYIWKEGKDGKEPNNWGSTFEGSAWNKTPETDEYYLHLFSPKQPDLNWDNPKLRKEVYDMMDWWLNKGVDGFRMDVISLISKDGDWSDGPVTEKGYGDGSSHYMTGPNEHKYLKEMRDQVLSKYDTITVGECPGATPEQALDYANLDGSELNMIFTFEHMDLDGNPDGNGKWDNKKLDLRKLKKNLAGWQNALEGKAWNSLYWNNHDQPRVVSRFGNDSPEYRKKSAKMLGTILHMMQGTPYIFQGEEIGMTNYPFQDLSDFRDIESLNAYKAFTDKGIYTLEEMFSYISYKGRDNARTPMQWDDSEQAGFTTGTPWIQVNPNYKDINVKEALADEDSIFHYYKKLIALRKEYPIIRDGHFELLLPDSKEIFAYTRSLGKEQLLAVANFADHDVEFDCPKQFIGGKILIENEPADIKEHMTLHPYQAFVVYVDGKSETAKE